MDWSTVKGTNGMMHVKVRSNVRTPASGITPHNPGKNAGLLLIYSKHTEICKREKLNFNQNLNDNSTTTYIIFI